MVKKIWKFIEKELRRIIVILISIPIFIIGIILLFIPGPGLLFIFLGFVILSYEFNWAKKLKEKVLERINNLKEQAKKK